MWSRLVLNSPSSASWVLVLKVVHHHTQLQHRVFCDWSLPFSAVCFSVTHAASCLQEHWLSCTFYFIVLAEFLTYSMCYPVRADSSCLGAALALDWTPKSSKAWAPLTQPQAARDPKLCCFLTLVFVSNMRKVVFGSCKLRDCKWVL